MRSRSVLGAALAISAVIAACAPWATGCSDGSSGPATSADCDASNQAFVRKAMLAVVGRRPWGQAEVDAYEDVLDALVTNGADRATARKLVVEVMMQDPAYLQRWEDFFMDALGVARVNTIRNNMYQQVEASACYGSPSSQPADDGSLAAWVRDNYPSATDSPRPGFTLGDLLSSCIVLDDVSPIYRAHLFNMMTLPLQGANVDPMDLELARRTDFGQNFEQRYLQRDPTCMPCHNSETSVTYDPDPVKNRAWPMPGYFEQALYGSSSGADPIRSRSLFRFLDVAVNTGKAPWGWNPQLCGTFAVPQQTDPLGVDAYFGSIHDDTDDPQRGLRASVWALEVALRRGIDGLAGDGLKLSGHTVEDPDQALAYLVGASITEQVWTEVVGTRLTIANHFPRTEAQRDILKALTDHFVESHFSLKTLLLDIVLRPEFNLKAPDEGCGGTLYSLPRVFDPWTNAEADPSRRGNSPADDVHPLSGRVLVRSLHRAMQWPFAPDFPNTSSQPFETGVGLFMQKSQPGFAGLDFQARLWWESAYGSCPSLGSGDFIHDLVDRAKKTSGATVGDAIVALKDRLIGEPWIGDAEKPALEQLIGDQLEQRNFDKLDSELRIACGAYVASPQFLLGGIAPPDSRTVPKLSAPEHDYGSTCSTIAHGLDRDGAPYRLTCGAGSVKIAIR